MTISGRTAKFDYEDGKQDPHLATFPSDGLLLLYVPEGNQGNPIRITDFLPDVDYRTQWLNPRDGSSTQLEKLSTGTAGTIRVPERLSNKDWLLLLTVDDS